MNRLRNLKITRVDRCFKGTNINPEAEIVLFKAKAVAPADSQGALVAETETQKALADKVLRLETDLAASQETLSALSEMDNETLAALRGFEIAKAEPDPDAVLKALPDEVRERIEKAEATVAKMEREQRAVQFAKAAEEYTNIASPADLAPVLEAVDRLDPEVAKALTPILKAANARIGEGDLFAEYGKAEAPNDPFAVVKAQADEIRKADPELSKADALQKAMAQNPEAARQAFGPEYAASTRS